MAIITVDNIISSLKKSPEYSGDIKKRGNQIKVYLNISIKAPNERIKKLEEIKEYLKNDIPAIANTIAYNKRPPKGASSIGRLEILRNGMNPITIEVKPIPKLPLNIAWRLNEEMLPEIAMEYYSYAAEDGGKFKIKLTDGRKSIIINDVKSVVRVGGKNKKVDVLISTNAETKYKISMKMPKFKTWQNGANSSTLATTEATKVLNNISNLAGAFSKPNSKVSVESIEREVIEFCFGGYGENKVDYIITSNFPNISPSKSFVYDNENKVLTINVDKIYSRNSQDQEELREDCYMLIEKDRGSNISSKYPGFKISYVSKSIADNALPGKR